MIFSNEKALFIHIPKTAGNSLQTLLVGRSDDSVVRFGHQDGKDRFEVRGSLTRSKHATVADYAGLGVDTDAFTVITTVRHPFERAISLYFSPHRWMRRGDDGSWSQVEPVWDERAFRRLVTSGEVQSMTSFLKLNGRLPANLEVMRFEQLPAEAERVLSKVFDIVLNSKTLVHVNKSAARSEDVLRALQSVSARELAREVYREDFEVFGY